MNLHENYIKILVKNQETKYFKNFDCTTFERLPEKIWYLFSLLDLRYIKQTKICLQCHMPKDLRKKYKIVHGCCAESYNYIESLWAKLEK